MSFKNFLLAAVVCAAFASCGEDAPVLTKSGINKADFTSEYEGKHTSLYTLKNKAGMEVCVTNFGGRIVSIMVPDRNGNLIDVVHGFDKVAGYFPENNENNFGATIGRYANRIRNGIFMIDTRICNLPTNNFGHCLHGGPKSWNDRVFYCEEADDSHVKLSIISPDGDNGFPGNVNAKVTFTLRDDNSLDISYEAVTDSPTVINMTNHSYFNLAGDDTDLTVADNILYINASNYTPVDSTLIPTGEIVPVSGTPLDFTTPKRVDQAWDQTQFDQIAYGRGVDHNWVLDSKGDITQLAASVMSPATGIKLEVYTNEPGLQVYSGNFLDGTVIGKKNRVYGHRTAICLETQKYPDTPNKPAWPSAVVRPGEVYNSQCIYKFSVE